MVAVTGASGYIGTRLLQELQEQEEPHNLVAIDTRPLPFPVLNVAAYRRDVTEPISDVLLHHRATTLVHLAFGARRGRNRREVDAIQQANLVALAAVLDSCVRANLSHFIYLSSHTVYGAHPDNPIPLTDKASPRPIPDFPYGYDKYLSELTILKFAERHTEVKVTILRSCIVLGPSGASFMTGGLFRPWLLGVLGYNPPLQFLHEDDLARALTMIIRRKLPGVFNVAGEGVVYYHEMAKIIKSRLIVLPAFLAYPLAQLTWNLRLQRDSTAAGLDLVRYPMVLSTGKLTQATGYRFLHTSLETLTSFANSFFPNKGSI
jgi:UDP-glucose 4-epimerase